MGREREKVNVFRSSWLVGLLDKSVGIKWVGGDKKEEKVRRRDK